MSEFDPENGMNEFDPEKGKSFWPIKEGDHPNINDAYKTLYDLSDAELGLTFYDDTGNILTDELCVEFFNCYVDPDGVALFAKAPLRKLLEEALDLYIEEETQDSKRGRLLSRLVKAFDEP